MKRKVNQIGPATLMVSLPAKWVKKHNVKKGDEIDIFEQEGKLVIGGEGKEPVKRTTIDLNSIPEIEKASDNFYRRLFSNAYKKGFDEIEVIFPGKNVLYRIAEAIKYLIGYEIFDQTERKCLIRTLASEREEEFERMVRKSFLLMKQVAEITLDDAKSADLNDLENIKNMINNVQKYTDFCRRLINKKIFKNDDLALYYYIICMRIILIANKFKYIYEYLAQSRTRKLGARAVDYFTRTKNLIDIFYETYYKKNIRNIEKIDKEKTQLIEEAKKFFMSTKGHDSVIVYYLAEVVRLVYDNSSQMMGIVL